MRKILSEPSAKAEIIERINRLAPDTQRRWGKMTVQQMVSHLNDSHKLVMGEIKTNFKSNFFNRTVVRLVALRAPMQWPSGVATVPELNQSAGAGTPPTSLEADRQQLLTLIARFTANPRAFQFVPHPIFGEMTEWEWMRWAYLHADHHLRQFGL